MKDAKKGEFTHDGVMFKVGDDVVVDVVWPGGRKSQVHGKLITIANDEAYVESQFGPVVGILDSLEPA